MSINMIGNVACRKNAVTTGMRGLSFNTRINDQVATIHVHLPLKQVSVGFVANRDKYAGQIELLGL